jgi:hypothetical protein
MQIYFERAHFSFEALLITEQQVHALEKAHPTQFSFCTKVGLTSLVLHIHKRISIDFPKFQGNYPCSFYKLIIPLESFLSALIRKRWIYE